MEIIVFLSIVIAVLAVLTSIVLVRRVKKQIAEMTDAVTTDAQGNLYVSVDLPDHGVLFSYLLSFGDSVEVLEPASVREQVKEKLISMLRIYKT